MAAKRIRSTVKRPVTIIEAIKPEAPKKLRVAAYCRVSTSHLDQAGSFKIQKQYFERMFRNSLKETLVDVYADLGISGTRADFRPDFQRLLTDCRKGLIDRIITKSISRFARNTRDCLTVLRELKALGITVLFEKEGIDTARISDEIMITVMEGLAQEEAMSISRNTRWSLQRRMKNGTLKVARVPYGYVKDENRNLVVDEEKADIIREIFELYLSGYGARRISAELNYRNIPSPTGQKWNQQTILKILAQEKYLGDIRWQKTFSIFMGNKNRINNGDVESYYIRNAHPQIIDRETFAKAGDMRAKIRSSSHRAAANNNIFKSKLTCSCGRSFVLSRSTKTDSWRCTRQYDPNNPCNAPAVKNCDVEKAWSRFYRKLRNCAGDIFLPVIRLLDELEGDMARGLVKELEEQNSDLYDRRYTLRKLCLEGIIKPERLVSLEGEIEREMRELEEKLDRLTGFTVDTAEDIKNAYNAVFILTSAQFLDKQVDKIRIDGDTAEIVLNCGLRFRERVNG